MSVVILRRGAAPSYTPPIGRTWLLEESGEWICPASGTYQIEGHGGGGGAMLVAKLTSSTESYLVCTGGGSGEVYEQSLVKNQAYAVTIGAGGSGGLRAYLNGSLSQQSASKDGEASYFGSLEFPGGGKATCTSASSYAVGTASGSLATGGNKSSWVSDPTTLNIAGGYGNKNNTNQPYGNGGSGVKGSNPGEPGAIIITFVAEAGPTITFRIKSDTHSVDETYTAEEGMTWADWVSAYVSDDQFVATSTAVQYYVSSLYRNVMYNGSNVKPTDTIVAGRVYDLSVTGTGGSND